MSVSTDPIFESIRRAQSACRIHGTCIDMADAAEAEAGSSTPEATAARRRADEARDNDIACRWQVAETPPTTPAGMLAYLDFFESQDGFGADAHDEDHMKAVIGAVRGFAAGLIVGPDFDPLEFADRLAEVRHLLEALFMMANGIGDIDQTNAVQRVVIVALDKMEGVLAVLGEEPEPEGEAE